MHLIASRRLLLIAFLASGIELSLPLWASRAFKITHNDFMAAVPVAIPVQFLVVALLLYTVSSSFARMERLAVQPMSLYQLGAWGALAVPMAAATTAACVMIGDSGSLGVFAPLRALSGMWGIGLAATALMDRRAAGVVPLIAIVLPTVLSPTAMPGGDIWAFAISPNASIVSWITALVLLLIGVICHTRWVERRRR